MNLKVMRRVLGMHYSSRPAPSGSGEVPLSVEVARQIPRRVPGIRVSRGVVYRDRLRLEVQVPPAAGRFPLVVYLPGGGFVVAPRRMARRQRAWIAAAGYVVAGVAYRTTRQGATLDDALADVRDAVTFLTERADEFRIDAERIALWGESAGGYLASVAGLGDERIGAVVDQFGASDLARVAEGFDEPMVRAMGDLQGPIRRFRADETDPVDLIHPGAPPFLLLHGDDDRVISPVQTRLLHEALLAAGAVSKRYVLGGAGHGRLSLTGRQARVWTSVEVMSLIREFLDGAMKG